MYGIIVRRVEYVQLQVARLLRYQRLLFICGQSSQVCLSQSIVEEYPNRVIQEFGPHRVMVTLYSDDILISCIDFKHILAMVRSHEIIVLGNDKERRYKTGLNVIYWIKLFYVHSSSREYALTKERLY